MLVFATAITVFLVAVLAFFSLGYVRLLGSSNEQRNAIEAAALSAARDLSMIAIDTPEYGWISLSDSAPTGTLTMANDQYNTPVRSINGIIGTLRLDLIIATELGDANLKEMIKHDLDKAKTAQDTLGQELQKALGTTASATTINGTTVKVYENAENAYKANQIRMTGSSNYVKDSLKLSLGALNVGGITNIPLPNPASKAQVPSNKQLNDFYLSYTNVPVGDQAFVFAGVGDSIKLIDAKTWVPQAPNLPYQLATVVKAEADQKMHNGQNDQDYTLHAVACAQPANVSDPKPAPGALTFSFPDGIPPEIVNPMSMLTNPQLNNGINCTYQGSRDGDYPLNKPASHIDDIDWPYPSLAQSTGNVFRQALFDWWKRAGTKLNVSSAVAMINDTEYKFAQPSPAKIDWKTPAKVGDKKIYNFGPIPNGNIHIYRVVRNTGKINYETKPLAPINYSVAGENQMYSENIDALISTTPELQIGPFDFPNTGFWFDYVKMKKNYDCYIRDQVYQPGKTLGGKHAGEPMDFNTVALARPAVHDLGGSGMGAIPYPKPKGHGLPPAVTNQSDFAETAGFPSTFYNTYSQGPGKDHMRPTYQTNGMAVDVRFRRQVDTQTMSGMLGFGIGYVGEKYGNDVPAEIGVPRVETEPDPETTTTGATTGATTGSAGAETSGTTTGSAGAETSGTTTGL